MMVIVMILVTMVAFNMSSRLPLPAPGRDNKCLQTWSPLSAFGPLVLSTSRALSACVWCWPSLHCCLALSANSTTLSNVPSANTSTMVNSCLESFVGLNLCQKDNLKGGCGMSPKKGKIARKLLIEGFQEEAIYLCIGTLNYPYIGKVCFRHLPYYVQVLVI